MSKKRYRKQKPKIDEVQQKIIDKAKEALAHQMKLAQDPSEGGPQPPPESTVVKDNLKKSKTVAIIVTNTEPEAAIFCTPIFRMIKHDFKIETLDLFVTKPIHSSFLEIISNDNIDAVEILEKIDDAAVEEFSKRYDMTLMLNYGVAIEQGMNRGLNASTALGAVTQLIPSGPESMNFDVEITEDSVDEAVEMLGGFDNYIVVAPGFSVKLHPNWTTGRIWHPAKWMALLDILSANNVKVVVIGTNFYEQLLPDGIIDNVRCIYTNNVGALAEIIKRSKGVVTIDNGFSPMTMALGKKFVQIHSGGPISWSGGTYHNLSDHRDDSRVVASIDITSIEVDHVLEQISDLLLNGQKLESDVDSSEESWEKPKEFDLASIDPPT